MTNNLTTPSKTGGLSRRQWLSALATVTIVSREVLGGPGHIPPSEKLNIAGVGVGGQGGWDLDQVENENIVALCDVDSTYAAKTFARYPRAKQYRDYCEMFAKEKGIDAVVVGTPDHIHAVVSMMAIKLGKHVYCEKPLTRTIHEARALRGRPGSTRWPRRWATRAWPSRATV